MKIDAPKEILSLPKLKLAVIGHVEWVTFLKVDRLPIAGEISHAKDSFEDAAGFILENLNEYYKKNLLSDDVKKLLYEIKKNYKLSS